MAQSYEEYIEERFGRDGVELYNLCMSTCDKKNATAIYRALLRGNVTSISKLKQADVSTLRLRNIGEMRMAFIEEMQRVINT